MKNSKIKIVLAVVVIVLVGAGFLMNFKNKGINKINNEVKLSPDTLKVNTDSKVLDVSYVTFTSNNLGINLRYPKFLYTGYDNKSTPVSVVEKDNKLTVSAGNLGTYSAFIYHKESNETFEQSIMQQFVKKEYQNNPCTVKKISDNQYRITFPGDPDGSDYLSDAGRLNQEKCWTNPSIGRGDGNFVTDSFSNGYYIAERGTHDPTFGVASSLQWWPKGIKFFKYFGFQTDFSAQAVSGKYKNDKLGISFSYLTDSIKPVTRLAHDIVGFVFIIEVANGVTIGGRSYDYMSGGRGTYFVDFTQNKIGDQCSKDNPEVIIAKNGQKGVYVFDSDVGYFESCKDLLKTDSAHFAVFDLKDKLKNIVFKGDPSKISKIDFLNFVKSVSF